MARLYACEAMTDQASMESMPGCACDFDRLPTGVTVADIIDQVSDAIFLATHGVISGRCTRTVRPTRTPDSGCWPRSLFELPSDGWYEEDGIPLDGINPEIIQVKINGAVVPATDYVLLDGHRLTRRSGTWPASQNVLLADSAEGTFSITYKYGLVLPLLARMAATEMACWLARWVVGEVASLPPGVTFATLDGATVTVDPEAVEANRTPFVSQLLALYGDSQAGVVWSVEMDGGWRLQTVS